MELDYTKMNGSNRLATFPTLQMKGAIELSKFGWPLVPLHYPTEFGCSCNRPNCSSNGKHPMNKHGLKEPLRNINHIYDWWSKRPQSNVGVLTGQETGIVVLDIDPRHGGNLSLKELEKEFGVLPETLSVKTGGDGIHFYFKHPLSLDMKNRANIRPGVDVRGDGGYVVAPPSIHATQNAYSWKNPGASLASLPKWLENLIYNPTQKKKVVVQNQLNLKETIHTKENAYLKEGNRNNALTSIAGLLQSKGVSGDEIQTILQAINNNACESPLETKEVESISKSINKYREKAWPEVKELPGPTKLPAMSAEMLPQTLRQWCLDISERMQVPLEFTACPALIMLASMIGRKIVVCPNKFDDWQVVPNLWGCLIAPPGAMKSPTISAVLKPLQNLALIAREKFKEEKTQKERQEIIANAEIEALKDALKGAVKSGKAESIHSIKEKLDKALAEYKEQHDVREVRYLINDPTIEKLLTILESNPQGTMLYRDELGGWLESIMKKSGREGDREFFLESWNGDSTFSMDRIGRGHTFVDGLCLSVLGGLQPGKFQNYVSQMAKGGKSDDGLLQRFQILLYPDRKKKWKKVDRAQDVEAERVIQDILMKIDQIPLPTRDKNTINRPQLHFSPAAQLEADRWREILENRLCQGKLSPIMEAHLSKYRSLMPSLALIFTLVDAFSEKNSTFPESISKEATLLAIQWCELLEAHAVKAYGEYIEPEMAGARKLVEKIKDGLVKDRDTCRQVYRKGWKGLTNHEEVTNSLKILKEFGIVRIETINPEGGGRSEVIRINPIMNKFIENTKT